MNNFEEPKKTYLFLVSFGCHSETIKDVEEIFRYYPRSEKDIIPSGEEFSSIGISNFFFLEYFLLNPNSIKTEKLEGTVFAPFYERIIRDSKFLPDWNNIKQRLENANTVINDMQNKKIRLYPRDRKLEKYIIKDGLEAIVEKPSLGSESFESWKESLETPQNPITKDYPINFTTSIKQVREENIKWVTLEQLLLIYPFYLTGSKNIRIIVYPIASNKIFYGYIIIGYRPLISSLSSEFEESLNQVVRGEIKDLYLPALVLCHNSFYERQMEKGQIGKDDIQKDIIFCNDEIMESSNIIETRLHFLWKQRYNNFEKISKNDNYIFADRFFGSKKSIKILTDVMNWDPSFGNEGTDEKQKLKTFLITGGPGAGKEFFTHVVALFSRKHFLAKSISWNMASLKPEWLAPPTLMGTDYDAILKIKGLFEKALNPLTEEEAVVIVLDELNSLDIDAQGTLLRLIENEEIVPIGGIDNIGKKEKIKSILLIGVMNEVAEDITQENLLGFLKGNKTIWGSLLSNALYEFYRKMRRLRDDLYYRFIREGYIDIPDLDARRADIPIIFFVNLPKDIQKKIIDKNFFLEYDFWNQLIDPMINWKGNVRQLQAITIKIAREIREKIRDKKDEYTAYDLRKLLKKSPELMLKIQSKES